MELASTLDANPLFLDVSGLGWLLSKIHDFPQLISNAVGTY
jgi:hypothetical protein